MPCALVWTGKIELKGYNFSKYQQKIPSVSAKGIFYYVVELVRCYITSIPCSAQSFKLSSFNLNFWILPLPVIGNSLMKKMYFGIL